MPLLEVRSRNRVRVLSLTHGSCGSRFLEKGGSQDPDGPIGAIVYDLDQTLIDSGMDLRYEENMAHAVMPYKVSTRALGSSPRFPFRLPF